MVNRFEVVRDQAASLMQAENIRDGLFDQPQPQSKNRTASESQEVEPLSIEFDDPYVDYGETEEDAEQTEEQTGDQTGDQTGEQTEERTTGSEDQAEDSRPKLAEDILEALTNAESLTITDSSNSEDNADLTINEDGDIVLGDDAASDGELVVQIDSDLAAKSEQTAALAALRQIYDELVRMGKGDMFPKEAETALVQTILDNAERVKWEALSEENKEKADIIIDKDGKIHMNPDRAAGGSGGDLLVVYETDTSAMEAALSQKAAVRDLMKYFKMNNPNAVLPAAWAEIEAKDVPPPTKIPRVVGGGAGLGGGDVLSGGRSSGGGGGVPSGGGGYTGGGGGSVGGGGTYGSGGFRGDGGGVAGGDFSADVSPITSTSDGRLGLTDTFVDRVIEGVSSNEGGYTAINPDDAGYGISVGIRQWNQEAGELPTLLHGWNGKGLSEEAIESLEADGVDPSKLSSKFEQIFGPYAEKMMDESWVRSHDMAADGDFMGRMATALGDKDFQAVQRALARDFVYKAAKLGYDYGFRSELGLALVADIANQKGFGGAQSVLRGNGLQEGGPALGDAEGAKIEQVGLNSDRPNAQQRFEQLKGLFKVVEADLTEKPSSGTVPGKIFEASGYAFPVAGYEADSVELHHGSYEGASDIFAARGTPVVALRGGKVEYAGYDETGGYNVGIRQDDGLIAYYAHMDQPPMVEAGQLVETGVQLGVVGDSGNAAGKGTHLHIGVGSSIILGVGPTGGAGANFDAVTHLNNILQASK